MPELVQFPLPEPTSQTKQCYACKQFKPLDQFRQVKRKVGRKPYTYCYDCDNERTRKLHKEKRGRKFKEPPPIAPGGQGRCMVCKQFKPLDQFCLNSKARSGFAATCKECASVAARKHYLKRQYGLSSDEYDAMLDAQEGVCAICQKPETVVHMGEIPNLSVDHCHKTKQIRSLLCYACNHLVGYIERVGRERVDAVFDYLLKHSSAQNDEGRDRP